MALIQHAVTSNPSDPATLVLPGAVTTGNLLIAVATGAFITDAAGVTSCTVNIGGTGAQAMTKVMSGVGNNQQINVDVFYLVANSAGTATFIYNSTQAAAAMALAIYERDDIDTATPVRAFGAPASGAAASAGGASPFTLTTPTTDGTPTTDDIAMAAFTWATGVPTSVTAGTGYTVTDQYLNATTNAPIVVEWAPAAAGAQTASLVATGATIGNYYGVIVAWKAAVVVAKQQQRPASDTAAGSWTDQAGGTSSLYTTIDESVASDTDYIKSPSGPSSAAYEAGLGTVSTPADNTHHVLRYRRRKGSALGYRQDITVELRNGASAFAPAITFTETDIGSAFATIQQALTSGQAAQITDYTALRARITANQTTGDAPAPTVVAAGTANGGTATFSVSYPTTPSNPVTDDIILLLVKTTSNVTPTLPAGWTVKDALNNGATFRSVVAWKRYGASDSDTSVSLTSPSGQTRADVVVIRGCVTTGDPFEAYTSQANVSSTTCTMPTITSLTNNALIVAFITSAANTAVATIAGTTPTFTERFDAGGTTARVALDTGIQATAGAVASKTTTVGSGLNNGALGALKPAPLVATTVDVSWLEFETAAPTTSTVGQQVVASWHARAALGQQVQATWLTRAPVGQQVAQSWHARARIGQQVAANWAVRTPIGAQCSATWPLRAAIGQQVATSWNVAGVLAAVGQQIAATWHARAATGQQASATWGVRTALNKDAALGWATRIASGQQIAATWHTRAALGQQLVASWNVARNGGIPAMPIVNRAVATYVNNGGTPTTTDASNDTAYDNTSSGAVPWARTYDLVASLPSVVFCVMYHDATGNYREDLAGSSVWFGIARDYTIDVSNDRSSWTNKVTVTNNLYTRPAHIVDMAGFRYLRWTVTASRGSFVTSNVDIHDASASGTDYDAFALFGDSWTQEGQLTYNNLAGGAWQLGMQGKQIRDKDGTHTPVWIDAGSGGMDYKWLYSNRVALFGQYPGKRVILCMGTNDINVGGAITGTQISNPGGTLGNPGTAGIRENLRAIIAYAQGLGKTVIVSRIPSNRSNANNDNNALLVNQQVIDPLTNPASGDYIAGVIAGPDLWQVFHDHPEILRSDKLHPTYNHTDVNTAVTQSSPAGTWHDVESGLDLVGYETVIRWYRDALIANVYNAALSTTTVGQQVIATWQTRFALGQQAPAAWNTRAALGTSSAQAWQTRATTGAQAAASWQIRAAIGQQSVSSWSVRGAIGQGVTSSWQTRAALGQQFAASWPIRSAVGQGVISSWPIRSATGQGVASSWGTRAALQRDSALAWAVRGLAAHDIDASWAIRTSAGQQGVARWHLRATAGRGVDSAWDVAGILAAIGQSLVVGWGVLAPTGRGATATWQARALAGQGLDARWHDRQRVDTEADLRWAARSATGQQALAAWAVRALVAGDVAPSWATRRALFRDTGLAWPVRATIGQQAATGWAVNGKLRADLLASWNVRSPLHRDAVLAWMAAGSPTAVVSPAILVTAKPRTITTVVDARGRTIAAVAVARPLTVVARP